MENRNNAINMLKTLSECTEAMAQETRYNLVRYCLAKRNFTDIVTVLKLNPASFRFHLQKLADCGLIEKPERGIYKTTELGKQLLQLAKLAEKGAK